MSINLFAINLLGTHHADHTLLVATYTVLIILALLLLRKGLMQAMEDRNKKR